MAYSLYLQPQERKPVSHLVVPQTLLVEGMFPLAVRDIGCPYCLFTQGDKLPSSFPLHIELGCNFSCPTTQPVRVLLLFTL